MEFALLWPKREKDEEESERARESSIRNELIFITGLQAASECECE